MNTKQPRAAQPRTETGIATCSLPAALGLPGSTPLIDCGLRGALTIHRGTRRFQREVRA